MCAGYTGTLAHEEQTVRVSYKRMGGERPRQHAIAEHLLNAGHDRTRDVQTLGLRESKRRASQSSPCL